MRKNKIYFNLFFIINLLAEEARRRTSVVHSRLQSQRRRKKKLKKKITTKTLPMSSFVDFDVIEFHPPPPPHSTQLDLTRLDSTRSDPAPLSFVHCNFLSLWVERVWSLLCRTQVRTKTLPATSKVIFLAEYSVDSDAFGWWWWWWWWVFYFYFFFPKTFSLFSPLSVLIG